MLTVALLVAAWLLGAVYANEMVGPGAMTPFSGGGGEREYSYGYMDSPAIGFFVGGSSVTAMNGLYDRVENVDNGNAPNRKAELSYRNEMTQWHLVLMESSEEVPKVPREPRW